MLAGNDPPPLIPIEEAGAGPALGGSIVDALAWFLVDHLASRFAVTNFCVFACG